MAGPSRKAPSSAAAASARVGVWAKIKAKVHAVLSLLRDPDEVTVDVFDNEAQLRAEFDAIGHKVWVRSLWIIGLVVALIFLTPVLKPIYRYQTISDDKRERRELVALSEPNLTDQAILSWAATGITEIMTFGFGDFDRRILGQRKYFTDVGWSSFTKALRDQNLREKFKSKQLVLTAVPSDMPVITSKGLDKDGEEVWIIEMPVIMTYTTNNEVSRPQRGLVILTMVRVPSKQNVAGIGIKTWLLF